MKPKKSKAQKYLESIGYEFDKKDRCVSYFASEEKWVDIFRLMENYHQEKLAKYLKKSRDVYVLHADEEILCVRGNNSNLKAEIESGASVTKVKFTN